MKQVRSITAVNQETAENIRTTRIAAVIDGSTGLLKSFTELKKQLELDDLTDTDNAIKKLRSAINAVQNLRNEMEAF